jgi:hypothetical protein
MINSFTESVEAAAKAAAKKVGAAVKAADKADAKFDPEGSGYDYVTAKAHGLKPDKTGHWPSRSPKDGRLLKGRRHKTWHMTEKGEKEAGYSIYKDPKSGFYFSKEKK